MRMSMTLIAALSLVFAAGCDLAEDADSGNGDAVVDGGADAGSSGDATSSADGADAGAAVDASGGATPHKG